MDTERFTKGYRGGSSYYPSKTKDGAIFQAADLAMQYAAEAHQKGEADANSGTIPVYRLTPEGSRYTGTSVIYCYGDAQPWIIEHDKHGYERNRKPCHYVPRPNLIPKEAQ